MSTHDHTHNTATTLLQRAAMAVSITFIAVGILGFVPGITTDYDQLELAGHESGAKLLGIFEVSVLHNVVHLLFGLVGLMLARRHDGAKTFLIGGGIVYFVLFLYGILIDHDSAANFVPLNSADNVLHLVLAVAMVGLGLALSKRDHQHH